MAILCKTPGFHRSLLTNSALWPLTLPISISTLANRSLAFLIVFSLVDGVPFLLRFLEALLAPPRSEHST